MLLYSLETFQQLIQVERLANKDRPPQGGPFVLGKVVTAGYYDHFTTLSQAMHKFDEPDSVKPRQSDVGYQDIVPATLQLSERGLAVAATLCPLALSLEKGRHGFCQQRLVLDNQDR